MQGYHTLVTIGNFIVLFGGLQLRKDICLQPFSLVEDANHNFDIVYSNDVFVYDILNCSWHKTTYNRDDLIPAGRYGHCAAAINTRLMLVYGGRMKGGRYLSDSWIYDIIDHKWTCISESLTVCPSPRAFAAVTVPYSSHTSLLTEYYDDIVLFGGTDGIEIFSDLWLFKKEETYGQYIWERQVPITAGQSSLPAGR